VVAGRSEENVIDSMSPSTYAIGANQCMLEPVSMSLLVFRQAGDQPNPNRLHQCLSEDK
jgi:hypothetical protein